MGSEADILRSLILDLERFGRQVEGITSAIRAQSKKASDHLDDSYAQLKARKTRIRKNGSFFPR